jgi:hypothetical protein
MLVEPVWGRTLPGRPQLLPLLHIQRGMCHVILLDDNGKRPLKTAEHSKESGYLFMDALRAI